MLTFIIQKYITAQAFKSYFQVGIDWKEVTLAISIQEANSSDVSCS